MNEDIIEFMAFGKSIHIKHVDGLIYKIEEVFDPINPRRRKYKIECNDKREIYLLNIWRADVGYYFINPPYWNIVPHEKIIEDVFNNIVLNIKRFINDNQ